MDIVSRLKQFLEATGTSNSLFADTCGIARPTLSQLLTGRNKRVSDEMLAKIHASYPSINMMWLAFGEGEMFGPNANNSDSTPMTGSDASLNGQQSAADSLSLPFPGQQGAIHFGDDSDESPADDTLPTPLQSPVAAPSSPAANPMLAAMSGAGAGAQKTPKSSDGRRIVSITVFYNDNSFETFTPSN